MKQLKNFDNSQKGLVNHQIKLIIAAVYKQIIMNNSTQNN